MNHTTGFSSIELDALQIAHWAAHYEIEEILRGVCSLII